MSFLNKLSPFQKIQFLGMAFLLLGVVAYWFSIRNTLEVYRSYQQNLVEIKKINTAPAQIQNLNRELANFEKNFGQYHYDRQILFETINTFCRSHQLNINLFHPETKEIINDIEIVTNQIEVSGGYLDLVQLQYEIEYLKKLGHIASARFERKEDRKSRKKTLTATFYIRHLQTNNKDT